MVEYIYHLKDCYVLLDKLKHHEQQMNEYSNELGLKDDQGLSNKLKISHLLNQSVTGGNKGKNNKSVRENKYQDDQSFRMENPILRCTHKLLLCPNDKRDNYLRAHKNIVHRVTTHRCLPCKAKVGDHASADNSDPSGLYTSPARSSSHALRQHLDDLPALKSGYRSATRADQGSPAHAGSRPCPYAGCGTRFNGRAALSHHVKSYNHLPNIVGFPGENSEKQKLLLISANEPPHVTKLSSAPTIAKPIAQMINSDPVITSSHNSYTCSTCEAQFLRKSHLIFHINKVHNIRRTYDCHVCARAFNTRYHLNRHIGSFIHIVELPYRCSDCGLRFATEPEREKHLAQFFFHRDPTLFTVPKYVCYTCTYPKCSEEPTDHHIDPPQPRLDDVMSHIKVVKFASMNLLRRHMQSNHTKTGPFARNQLYISNNDPESMGKRRLGRPPIKSTVTPHACPFCDKTFSVNFALKNHIRSKHPSHTHTLPKRDRTFAVRKRAQFDSGQLAGHLCEYCGKNFLYNRSLTQHKKFMHRAELLPSSDQGDPPTTPISKSLSPLKGPEGIPTPGVRTTPSPQRDLFYDEATAQADISFRCTFCGWALVNRRALRRHLKIVHPTEKDYTRTCHTGTVKK